jgi:hypothetical protein
MGTYESVMDEVERRAHELIRKGATTTMADAIGEVFKQSPELYAQYRRRPQPHGVEAEVLAKADALVSKQAGLSQRDAIAQVLNGDPGLYARYRKQDAGMVTAPTFGSELASRQVDDLYEFASALMTTIGGILRSDAGDKGGKIATALDDFRAAILTRLQQAGLSVPTQKRGSALIPERTEAAILKTALTLCPQDPQGKGMQAIEAALTEVRNYAAKRTAA